MFKRVLMAVLFLSACGGSADDDSDIATEEARWAAEDAAADAEEAEYRAWAESDDRPVNLACTEPGYTRGQSETYIGLSSPLYPAVAAKREKLLQQHKDIQPTIGDEEVYDLKGNEKIARDMAALGHFTFIMGIDVSSRGQLVVCGYEQYDMDKCNITARLAGATVEDVVKEGDALSFTSVFGKQKFKVNMQLKNPDLDGVKMAVLKGGVASVRGVWNRADDGTEMLSARSDGDAYSYTENPDCSGTARWHRRGDYDRPATTTLGWTSARNSDFRMTYSLCAENDLGEEQCHSGSF